MDATLKAPFCHMRQPRCAARRYSAIAYEGEAEAAAGLPCAGGGGSNCNHCAIVVGGGSA